MTGPAQTPVLFLKSGGGSFFSAQCQEALASAGLNPDWFGDYDSVSKKIRDAKVKRAKWAGMTPSQQAANPDRRPTPEDVFLSNCTASHLTQDGVYRRARVPNPDGTVAPPLPPGAPMGTPGAEGRGDPCASLVAGYTEGTAPCFPGEGSDRIPGSMERQLGEWERQQIREERARSGDRYPAAALTRDENLRSEVITEQQRDRWNTVRNDPTRGGDGTGALAGSGPRGTAATPGEQAAFANAVGVTGNGQPTAPANQVINGTTADECINAWRERAKEEMRTKALDNEVARTAQETTPAAQTAAAKRLRGAEEHRARAERAAAAAQERADRTGTAQDREARDRAEARLSAARLREATARERQERCQTAAARLPCLRAMQPGGANSTNRDGRTFP
jgi:hypothetical protein